MCVARTPKEQNCVSFRVTVNVRECERVRRIYNNAQNMHFQRIAIPIHFHTSVDRLYIMYARNYLLMHRKYAVEVHRG